MKNLIYLHCFVLIILLSACNSDEMQEEKEDYPEYFVFGLYYGHCDGADQCIEIYKIQNDSLFEAEDIYPDVDQEGLSGVEFYFIGNEKLPLVIDLEEKIPEELLSETSYYIGCPDCTDQGGIFIEISTPDFHHFG